MDATTQLQRFAFDSARVRLDRSGAAVLSSAHALDAADGLTVCAYAIARNEDLHPDLWEVHPAGDEVLLMFSGAIDVVIRREGVDTTTRLDAGHGLIVPRGAWHRLTLRSPGLLVVVTPRAGTRLEAAPR